MEKTRLQSSLRHKLGLLYALNAADWLCTVILLRTGGFYEANPLMQPIVGNLPLSFAVKCILPALLILFVLYVTIGVGVEELRRIDKATAFALTFYTLLCAVHVVNFILLQIVGRAA